MAKYVFLGFESVVGTVKLTRFGQTIELPEDVADREIFNNVPILPAAKFDAIFNTEELKADLVKFHAAPLHEQASPEFQAKVLAARIALHEWRESIVNPVDKPVPTPVVIQPEPVGFVKPHAASEPVE
jgi:hypothetical protein